MEKWMSLLSRLFFVVALLLILMALIDWCLRLFGWTFSFIQYQPGRMLEFATMLMVFVAVIILRQIRENMKP